MIEAVHRHEGRVNQVMGDGISALFGVQPGLSFVLYRTMPPDTPVQARSLLGRSTLTRRQLLMRHRLRRVALLEQGLP
jgi:class 3 adenylate cyclase